MRQYIPESDAVPETESKVTILTWPSSYHFDKSTRHFALSEGHSALRTYRGGSEGKGMYVSFWPGENKLVLSCAQQNLENKDDTFLCHQNVPHFHSPDDDDLSYRNYPNIKSEAIELEGLNIEIINQSFIEKKEQTPQWTTQYNCSDLVLELLEKGGLYKKINPRRYGWKTIASISIFSSFILLDTWDFVWVLLTAERLKRVMPILNRNQKKCTVLVYNSISMWLLSRFGIYMNHPYFSLASSVTDGLIGAGSAYFLTYHYSLYSFSKSKIPKKVIYSSAKRDAVKAGTIAFLAEISSSVLAGFINSHILKYWFMNVQTKVKNRSNGIPLAILMITFNLLAISIPSFLKYLFDTTTTPRQVKTLLHSDHKKKGSKREIKHSLKRYRDALMLSTPVNLPKKNEYAENTVYLVSDGKLNPKITAYWSSRRNYYQKEIALNELKNIQLPDFPNTEEESIPIIIQNNPKLFEKLESICKPIPTQASKTFFQRIYNDKFTILSGTFTLSCIGFFAYKNSVDVLDGPKETIMKQFS